MTIRIEPASEAPCWALRTSRSTDFALPFIGVLHYDSRALAEEAATRWGLTARQRSEPCLVGVCEECGEALGGKDAMHYASPTEAEQAVAEGCPDCL